MRYNKIRKMDISDGPGVRVSIFMQGCAFNCEKCFNFGNVPQFCPFCGSDKIGRDVRRQRKTALALIDEYREITKRMEEFAQDYVKATQRVRKIRHELASYKCKGIITAEEIPYKKMKI